MASLVLSLTIGVARGEAAVRAVTVKCGAAPQAAVLTAEACGPWSPNRLYVQWFVDVTAPILGAPTVAFPGSTLLPPQQRCSILAVNPLTGFGDGVHTQKCQAQHPVGGSLWVPQTPAQLTVRVDETPPTVTPTLSRPPDTNGWYNKPVTITWQGSDIRSGVSFCTAPVNYAGPDTPGTLLTGTCTDNVGRISAAASHEIRYDATPPTLTDLSTTSGARRVSVSWTAGPDTSSVEVRRTNRVTGKSSVVFRGPGSRFVDRGVVPNGRYAYTVTVADEAGAATSAKVKVSLGLLKPAVGTRFRAAPVALSWPRVKDAQYYNVQLFVGGRKVMSAWPSSPALTVRRSWDYKGDNYSLPRGPTVTWYVWPAFGSVESPTFGPLIGRSSFRLRKL